MINIYELRLGNSILHGEFFESVHVNTLQMIQNRNSGYSGIPITEDRLLALGLEFVPNKSGKLIYYIDGIHFMLTEGVLITSDFSVPNSFDTIHLVQNFVYYLTGKRLNRIHS